MKTATIERHHVFGTHRHALFMSYRGWCIDHSCTDGANGVAGLLDSAKNLGFTHIRLVGAWRGISTRKTMKIQWVKS